MIRIWEEEVHFHKGYAFACTENTVATPYRLIFKVRVIISRVQI